MNAKNNGGPAFPVVGQRYVNNEGCALDPHAGHGWIVDPHPGATLRDYFAAKAMQASRSRPSGYEAWADLATDAYEIADAMLAARGDA